MDGDDLGHVLGLLFISVRVSCQRGTSICYHPEHRSVASGFKFIYRDQIIEALK